MGLILAPKLAQVDLQAGAPARHGEKRHMQDWEVGGGDRHDDLTVASFPGDVTHSYMCPRVSLVPVPVCCCQYLLLPRSTQPEKLDCDQYTEMRARYV